MILASGNGQGTEIPSSSSQPVLPTVYACILWHSLYLQMPALSYFSPQDMYVCHCWYSLSCTSMLSVSLPKPTKSTSCLSVAGAMAQLKASVLTIALVILIASATLCCVALFQLLNHQIGLGALTEMCKTDCSEQTRLVPRVPSSS